MSAVFTHPLVPQDGGLAVPVVAAVVFGLATLVVLSATGGSIAVSMTGMTVTVNTPPSPSALGDES